MQQIQRAAALLTETAGMVDTEIDEAKAMRNAIEMHNVMTGQHITAAQGWNLLGLFIQCQLQQAPTLIDLTQEMLTCFARASEESQLVAIAKEVAPFNGAERIAAMVDAIASPLPGTSVLLDEAKKLGEESEEEAETLDKPSEPTMAELMREPWDIPADTGISLTDLMSQDWAAARTLPNEPVAPKIAEQKYPEAKPDEIIVPGQIVKEYKNYDDYASGFWRPGYNYIIKVSPLSYYKGDDAPEYFIHCTERPSMELWLEHAELYNQRKCAVSVRMSDGVNTTNITEEYKNNTGQIGQADMRKPGASLDPWTEDAKYRISFHDPRTGGRSYVYFSHKPSDAVLKTYHRIKFAAHIESHVDWLGANNQSVI